MPGLLAIVLLIVPLVELWFILQVAEQIGVWETVLSLIVIAVLGTWLLTREGKATWTRLRAAVARGEVPTTELADGAAILVGGALLLTPGFLTDAIGLALIFPLTRVVATRALRRGFRWWIEGRLGRAATPAPSDPPARTLPSSQRRDGGVDSPDKG